MTKRLLYLFALLAPLAACGDDSSVAGPGAATGTVEVETVTTGQSIDRDGYEIVVGSESPVPVSTSGTASVDVPTGTHKLILGDRARNCSVSAPETVTVDASQTVQVTVNVSCESALPKGFFFEHGDATSADPATQVDGNIIQYAHGLERWGRFDVNEANTGVIVSGLDADLGADDLFLMTPEFDIAQRLTDDDRLYTDPRFGPGGEDVYYVTDSVDAQGYVHTDLYRMSIADGVSSEERLTELDRVHGFALSPDGKTAYLTVDLLQIQSLDLESGGQNLVHELPEGGLRSLRISPDGSALAYEVRLYDSQTQTSSTEIRHLDLDSGTETTLATVPTSAWVDDWHPSGDRIAFSEYDTGTQESWITTVSVDGGPTTVLARDPGMQVLNLQWVPPLEP
ncbi:MAG: hypothetical protein R3223_01920, partial [Longimicrobiales bacterium]|nr:hypothetical protein [Longimicrobiales bacterium]